MGEAQQIVELWHRARSNNELVYLATVVHVQGSSYRKPGARMLITSSGERAGTISGGCLEGEVSRRILWLTKNGPRVVSYPSSYDDDLEGVPSGLGCGGTVWLLLEQGSSANRVLDAMAEAIATRSPSVVVNVFTEPLSITTMVINGDRLIPSGQPRSQDERQEVQDSNLSTELEAEIIERARLSLELRRCIQSPIDEGNELPSFLCMPLLPPPQFHIFGAGDDVKPLLRFAADLGWQTRVFDGRSHLLRRERFPDADGLQLLPYRTSISDEHDSIELAEEIEMERDTVAVIMTHSFEQDRAILKALLPRQLRYLGILGPRHRTARIIHTISKELRMNSEQCFSKLHSPVGLALGSSEPAAIALSIVTEIQAALLQKRIDVSDHQIIAPHIQEGALFSQAQRAG